MQKNSTLELWQSFLKEEFPSFKKSPHQFLADTHLVPKKETINKILAYASSVKGIKMKSNDNILISLN